MNTNQFEVLADKELNNIEGGLVITIGALTITGAAIAKAATGVAAVYMAGYTLGSHFKAAEGRK